MTPAGTRATNPTPERTAVNKDVQQLPDRVRTQGFTVRMPRSGHYRVTSPAGSTVTVPGTPSGGVRSLSNARARLRRIGAQL